MNSKIKTEDYNIFAENCTDYISSIINISTEESITKYKLNSETLHNKEVALEYIINELSSIRMFLQQTTTLSLNKLNEYKDFIKKSTAKNIHLRREILKRFIDEVLLIILQKKHPKPLNLIINNHEYKEIYQLNTYKNFIKAASLLEYNHFLISELDKLNESKLHKLEWTGTNVELIELIKSLVTSKSIKGTEIEVAKVFGNYFGKDINNFHQNYGKIYGRETIFLNKLKKSLDDYRTEIDRKKDDQKKSLDDSRTEIDKKTNK